MQPGNGSLGYMDQIRRKLSTSQKVDGLLLAMLLAMHVIGGPKMFVVHINTMQYTHTQIYTDSTIYKRHTSE